MTARLLVEQECSTRVAVLIQMTSWDGALEVGRVEIDLAKHLDPRVSVTVIRMDEITTGPIEVCMK